MLLPPGRCLPVPPATDRAAWAVPPVDELRSRAAADLGTPWPVPLASGYARYFRDGDRDAYEQVVRARHERVTRAAVLAAVTLGERWLDEVADGVTLWCEQSSWCWPAHDDTYERHGSVVPTVTDPYLDLGAGEVAAELAWIDHLLGAQLDERTPGLRQRIRHEVERRVLGPFERRRDWHWLGLDGRVHNWNPWIHGNVLVAALQLVDEGERRESLIRLVIDGLDRYVAALPADGAIDEGYAYWWNGAGRLLEALDVLAYASGGVLNAEPIRVLRETVAFPHRMHLGGPWYVNFADCPARPRGEQPWHALHREARRAGDEATMAYAAAHRTPGTPVARESDGLGRLLRALTDPGWITATGAGSESWLPLDVWLPSTQVLVARMAAGSPAGLTLAVKGGHNGENHNHNDVGGFVVALGGVPVLVDPGRPTYTAQTFGPRRYELWPMRSTWHNVPWIRGREQAPGPEHGAAGVVTSSGRTYAQMSLDLANAYPAAGSRASVEIRRWRRTARLDRARAEVTVRDQWELAPAGHSPTRLHLIVAGAVRLAAGHAVITALDGAGVLRLSWSPPMPCTTTIQELDDPLLSDVWGDQLTRLEIDVSGLGSIGTLDLTVKEQQP
ncbi:heparinase [Actinoplanes cyaneus]|uniref:Heparinase n=2 Tax=Actinoplanes cyaneus TaxID=52696 RepID=A0A919IDS3_9ACTN|nr:Heparinase II/III-like protein [Actinoplanes cyaneus]GID63719.1 heparinase [Actinoplanes cyaneus]